MFARFVLYAGFKSPTISLSLNNFKIVRLKHKKMADQSNNQKQLGRIIYTAPEQMVGLVKMIKRLSISTTFISAGLQPFLYPKLIATGSTFAMGFATVTCAGIFVSPLILNWFTKRYVIQLHYDDQQKQFTAKRLNLINRPVTLTYKAQDVQIPDSLGIFTTYTVGTKKQPLFIDPNLVVDLEVYKTMLGFDKPIDLKREHLFEEMRKLKNEQKIR